MFLLVLQTPSLMPLDRPKLSKAMLMCGEGIVLFYISSFWDVNAGLTVRQVARVNLDDPEKIKTRS